MLQIKYIIQPTKLYSYQTPVQLINSVHGAEISKSRDYTTYVEENSYSA